MRDALYPILAAGLVAALPVLAAPPVALSGPEVAKLDWNTRSLSAADINGDGLTDLVVINNDAGKIELLLQRKDGEAPPERTRSIGRNRWEPVLEDAPFTPESVLTGLFAYAVTAADMNGDGKADLIYTGTIDPLTIRYQGEDGDWNETWTYDNLNPEQWVSTLAVADIDGDGRNDLAVLGKDELLIFRQNESGEMSEPTRFKMGQTNAHGLQLHDLNGDKLPDIIYLAGANQYRQISVRLQQRDGVFGPEFGFRMPTGAMSLSFLKGEEFPSFATIEGKTRLIETFYIEPASDGPRSLRDIQVRDYALGATVRQGNLYASGDFNGDGAEDIAVANPNGAAIILFLQTASGDFGEGVSYPSFSRISSITTLRRDDGPDALAVASVREEVAGVSTFTKEGRLSFPELLPAKGQPSAVTSGDYDGDGKDELLVVEKREKNAHHLTVFSNEEGSWVETSSTPIADVKRDIEAMLSLRLNNDARSDVILFAPREPARLFVAGEEGFTETATQSAVRRTSLMGADLGRLGVEDIDGDGQDEILVGDTGFVRALRLSEDGALEIVDQYNSRNSEAAVKGPVLLDLDNDDELDLVIYDDTSDKLELLKAGDDGVFRSSEVYDIGPINLLTAMRINLGRNHGETLALLGEDRFWAAPLDKPGWKRRDLRPAYETDLRDVQYTDLAAGDLNNDGRPEIVAIDGRQNILEVLTYDEEEGYKSALHFMVFDSHMMQGRGRGGSLEPREVLIDDFNGDGLDDIVLLVHDRVLLYKQVASGK